MNDRTFYFTTSAVCASLKTAWYAFTMPSSFRKFMEKDDSYKSHIKVLEKSIDKTGQDISLKKYVQIGDLTGYLTGLASLAVYAKESIEHPSLFLTFLGLNMASLGYETSRVIHKKRQKRK